MNEYLITGIPSPDARDASNLAAAAIAFKPHARQMLADLLEYHGLYESASRIRDLWYALEVWPEGSLILSTLSDNGDIRDVWQIGWHVPTAESYAQMVEVVHRSQELEPIDDNYGMVPW